MGRLLAKIILRLAGWKIYGAVPEGIKKCVITAAPHTSNLDFVYGRLAYLEMGVKVRFLIKKESFFFPLGPILKWLGGIPVDRGKNNRLVEHVSDMIRKNESIYIVITPEGTRKPNPRWKRGFYYIAERAGVPIALGYINYAKKEGGIGKVIYPSGDMEKDMREITAFYKGMVGKHPENFKLDKKSME